MGLLKLGAIVLVLLSTLNTAAGLLKCYECHSSQPGCNQDGVDWNLQGWKNCDGTSSEDAMCVKIVEERGSQKLVTRGCLSKLMQNTMIRYDVPSVRRHSYCVPARSDPTYGPSYLMPNTKKFYCFCNDLWICNGATPTAAPHLKVVTLIALVSLVIARFTVR